MNKRALLSSLVLIVFILSHVPLSGVRAAPSAPAPSPGEWPAPERPGTGPLSGKIWDRAGAVTVTYNVLPPQVARAGDYDRVTIPGLPNHGDPGAPVLPYRTAHVLLPFGASPESIKATLGEAVTLEGVYHIEPGQPLRPSFQEADEPTPPDPKIYGAAAPFPGVRYETISVQKLAGYTVLLLKIYPVDYLPASGKVSYYPQITLQVTTRSRLESAASDWLKLRPASGDAGRIWEMVDNPRLLQEYPQPSTGHTPSAPTSLVAPDAPNDYVIVTSEALSPTFRTLTDWKASRGLAAEIFTTEAIYANYSGADDAEKIRNFIVDAYTTWAATDHPLTYVVLGGDTEVVPIRSVFVRAGSYTTWMPVDLYYGGLDGDWDADGDGNYGEPAGDGAAGEEVDFFAEVYVGRFPVETSVEVTQAISKVVRYEQDPTAGYLDRALWLGRKLDDRTWGGDSKDLVSNIVPQYNVTTLYDRDGTYQTSKVIDAMNAGVHLVNFDGHGNPNCCPLNNGQVSALTNDVPFFFYNLGCNTAQFDKSSDEAVAEYYVFTEHGGFAYVGNNRYGWYSPGSTNGPGNQLDRLFFQHVVNAGSHHLGKALQLAKEDYYPGHRWSILTLTLLGDPETPLVTELPAPVANVSAPLGDATVNGLVDVMGTARAGSAAGATFDHYTLAHGAGKTPATWTQIGVTATTPVSDGLLGVWDTTARPDGTYSLRLQVSNGAGKLSEHRHTLTTDNLYLTSPKDGEFVRGGDPLTVTGSALGSDFTDYVVEYGQGSSPGSWTTVVSSTTPVTDGVLAVWDTSSVIDANDYTLRLRRNGTNYSESTAVTLYVDPAWQKDWPVKAWNRIVAPSLGAGDVDGDGDVEVVATANYYDGYSQVFVWNHDGSLYPGWPEYNSGKRISAPALADLDRDGSMEILAGAYDEQVYAWKGNNTDVTGWPQATGAKVFAAPSVADLDVNGAPDVAAATISGTIHAWRYDGLPLDGWPQSTGSAVYASPALGDVDGDNDLEVIVAGSGTVHVWHHDGTALAGWPQTLPAIDIAMSSPALGDVAGDGEPEIVVAQGTQVYAWHGDGSAVAGWPRPISTTVASSPALGDLDGSGKLEVVIAADRIYAWHGDGSTVAGWPAAIAAPTLSSPVLADVTGDGQLDVIAAGSDFDAQLYAWHGDGTPLAGWPHFISAFEGTDYYERMVSPLATDLDLDGDVEVLVGAEKYVFAFDMAGSHPGAPGWPTYQHDPQFTGSYGPPPNLPPFVLDARVTPGYVPPGGAVTITARIFDEDGVLTATAEIEAPDETVLGSVALHDDGVHGDGAAGDGIYGGGWVTPGGAKEDYLVDFATADALSHATSYDNATHFTTNDTAYVQFGAFTINRENLKSDGIASPGEIIEGSLTLDNIGNLDASGITLTLASHDACTWLYHDAATIGDVAAGSSATSGPYDVKFYVDNRCSHGAAAQIDLEIYDIAGHHRSDSFTLLVLDKLAPEAHSNLAGRYTPAGELISVLAYVYDTSGIRSVQATIESPDESPLITLPLYDDGAHDDEGMNDGVYGNSWTTPLEAQEYTIDLTTEDIYGNVGDYDNLDAFTTRPFSKRTNVLLFTDSGGSSTESYRPYYTAALKASNIDYDLWDSYWYGALDRSTMLSYTQGAIVWAIPRWGYYGSSTPDLSIYLDNGGKLFISGQDVGTYYNYQAFYSNYLHAQFAQSNTEATELEGASGDPIADGLRIGIYGGDGADNQADPDEFTPLTPARAVFTYTAGTTGTGALRVDESPYRLVYFGFGFEAINRAADRTSVMYRTLDWLLGGLAPSVDFTAAPVTGTLPMTVAFTGTVKELAPPYTATWDFGDGTILAGAPLTVTHTFTRAGAFDVRLTVANATLSLSAIHAVTATFVPAYGAQLAPPTLARSAFAGESLTATLTLTNTGTTSDTFALALAGNAWPAAVTPAQAGPLPPGASAPLSLTVSIPSGAAHGATDVLTLTAISSGDPAATARAHVTTTAIAPTVNFAAAPRSGEIPLTVAFTGTVAHLAPPHTATWDFGDGTILAGAPLTVTHTFTRAGAFDVRLTVANATLSLSATHAVTATFVPAYGAQLAPPALARSALAGESLTATLTLTNTGTTSDTFALALAGNAWPAAVTPAQAGPLPPGASAPLTLTVSVPSGTAGGATGTFTLTASSRAALDVRRSAIIVVRVGHRAFLPLVLRR